jgi:hypothetical protein
MDGLHCLLYDRQQLLTHLIQVHLLAQRLTEAGHDLGCVIFAAIKSSSHQSLYALAQGMEESGDDQSGDDKDHPIARFFVYRINRLRTIWAECLVVEAMCEQAAAVMTSYYHRDR